jgi:GR25 family glycosyltransferase involved in LPS biosynthesis
MTLAVAVVAHPQRAEMADKLAAEVDGMVCLDTECVGGVGDADGCARNHANALRQLSESDRSDWLVVLEDDAIPVPDFLHHAANALEQARSPLVGLYLGTGTNPDVQAVIKRALRTADSAGAAWIRGDCLLSTVGYAVRPGAAARVVDAITTITSVEAPLRITQWAQQVPVAVDYTWPSLVDHRDGYSTIAHRKVKGRRAHRHGTAAFWDTPAVALGPVPGWSAAA